MAPSLLRSPPSAREGRTPSESLEDPRAWWVVGGAFLCVAVIFGVALAVRVFAILGDGTLSESLSLLSAEALLLTLSIVGLVVDTGQRRQGAREAM